MISKGDRVPQTKIAYILRKGESTTSKFFIIRFTKSQLAKNRFRTIVSKKIDKSAVKRNKLRRQIYEAIRKNATQSKDNFDIILIPKAHITKASFAELEEDIKKLTSSLTHE